MKRANRLYIASICTISCLLGAAHWFPARPAYAQQNSQADDDGNVYVYAAIDVDSNYILYADSYAELDLDADPDIDAVYDEIQVEEDYGVFMTMTPIPTLITRSNPPLKSGGPVATGHEYGVTSVGWACYDDGEGGCDWEQEVSATARVYVQSPPPRIYGITPSTVHQGDQGTLTLTGADFIEYFGDQLTLNFSGGGSPFTLTSAPSSSTASFSYDFTGYPTGTYTLSVTNNEGRSDNKFFTVLPASPPPPPPPPDPCAVSSNPKAGYSSIVSTGTVGGSGTMTVSFSGAAYSAVSQTVSYGPYSTPSSIASNVAALITANYTKYGLTARAFGPNVVYSGTQTLGTVNQVITGPSVTTTTSSTAAAAAEMACGTGPPSPPPLCLAANPTYVLTVIHDSVTWINQNMNYGRNVRYSLELRPTTPNTLGAPATFPSTVTEHLSKRMSFGFTSQGNPGTGEFDDVLGYIGANAAGVYSTDRCFTVTSPTMGNLGHVLSYDAAGTHSLDYIQITPSTKTTILNRWTNPDGTPKNIEIP